MCGRIRRPIAGRRGAGRESSFFGLTRPRDRRRRDERDARERATARRDARARRRATVDRDPTTRDGSRRRTAATTTTRSVRVDGERAVRVGGGRRRRRRRSRRAGRRARAIDDRVGRRWTFHARVFEYVEGGPLAWEAVSTAAYVGAGRRGRRAATAMAVAVATMAHGARWTIGVVGFVCAFYAFAVAVRAAPFSARRKRTYVWVACVLAYLVLDELESEPGEVARVGRMNATTFNCYRACRFDLLRVMCFGVECVEETATPDLGKFVRYVLYPAAASEGTFLLLQRVRATPV